MSYSTLQYDEQKKEIDGLLSIHSEMRGTAGRGRGASNLEVLHKSAVVLLTACWESFIENILTESVGIMASGLTDTLDLPIEFRKGIALTKSKALTINATHELYPWSFAGDNWRVLVLKFAELKISELNTPNSENTKKLFSLLLGIEDITQSWARQRKAASDAADKLDNHLSDRHSIAHGGGMTKTFTKNYIINYRDFLDLTVHKTEKEIRRKLRTLGLVLS